MDTITSRRALIGNAGLAAVVAAIPVIAAANSGGGTASDPKWRAVVTDFRMKHVTWTATIGLEGDQMDAFREACASLGPEPKQPEDGLPDDIRHMTIAQIKAVGDTVKNKVAWADYKRDHGAWTTARAALRERIVGPANAQSEAASNARAAAFGTLANFPVRTLADLGEKIEIVTEDYAGCEVPIEYLQAVLTDVRRFVNGEG